MAEYTEDTIEKLSRTPLVQDPTAPVLASDDANAGGFVVVIQGEPATSDVPVWDAVNRVFTPGAAAAALPAATEGALLAHNGTSWVPARILTDAGSGDVLVDSVTGDVLLDYD